MKVDWKYLCIVLLRWLAVFDCLFSKNFELKTFNSNGKKRSHTILNSKKEWEY